MAESGRTSAFAGPGAPARPSEEVRVAPGQRRDVDGDSDEFVDDGLSQSERSSGQNEQRESGGSSSQATLSDRKKEFRIITFLLSPAIVTTFVFLGLYWDEDCGVPLRSWCLVEALRLVLSLIMSWTLQRDVERTSTQMENLEAMGRLVSMFSFVWFLLGHFWLLQGAGKCNQTAPHLFHLMAALIILQYTLMLLPLIVLIVLTPFLCLCLPCIIQGIYLLNKKQTRGATKKEISRLQVEKYSEGSFLEEGFDSQCAICIADFEANESIRVLPCKHCFHKDCVDSWLLMNGTCPICRRHIVAAKNNQSNQNEQRESSGVVEMTSREELRPLERTESNTRITRSESSSSLVMAAGPRGLRNSFLRSWGLASRARRMNSEPSEYDDENGTDLPGLPLSSDEDNNTNDGRDSEIEMRMERI